MKISFIINANFILNLMFFTTIYAKFKFNNGLVNYGKL